MKKKQNFEIFKNQIEFLLNSKFSLKNVENDPLAKIWSQMEIAMTLSQGAYIEPKSNFDT